MLRMLKSFLMDWFIRQNFNPGWLGIFINPFYFARSGLYRAIKNLAFNLEGNLLDIGCGSKPYIKLFTVDSYIGLELENKASRENKAADYYYDGNQFPFDDSTFRSVLSNQVLEHVFNPNDFIQEANRVLEKDGLLLITVPFLCIEHEQPFDYARYSSFGLCALLEDNGFKVIEQHKIGADASTLFQLANFYIYGVIQKLPNSFKFFIIVALMGPINLIGIIACIVFPKNPDFYLDQIVLAKKL